MSDFSRTLALLRREKKISQRAAAGDLGVSQALLSHYENGLREPGLSFVVRAADYYGVSCDYLLGRSMARDGSAVPAERMEGTDTETEHSQIVQAAALLLQVAESLESKQLSHEIEFVFRGCDLQGVPLSLHGRPGRCGCGVPRTAGSLRVPVRCPHEGA